MTQNFTVYPSLNNIWISIIICLKSQLYNQRNKKISAVFDEGLQKICYNELEDLLEIAKFAENEICWKQERLTLKQQQQ